LGKSSFRVLFGSLSGFSGLYRLPANDASSDGRHDNQPPIGPFEGCVPIWRVGLGLGLICLAAGLLVYLGRSNRVTFLLYLVCCALFGLGSLIWLTGHHWCGCQKQTEYSQPFTHGENVSQISVLGMSGNEMIANMKLFKFLWQKWPPGICIAVLAGAAAAFPVFTPTELTPIDKAKWTIGIGALLVLELVIIFKERGRQDREFAEDQSKRDAAHREQLRQLQELREASDAHNTAVLRQFMALDEPISGLKRRSLDLSEAILDFIYARIQGKPPEPAYAFTYIATQSDATSFYQSQSDRWAAQQRSLEYSKETWDMFLGRFHHRAVAIRDEFSKEHLADSTLDSYLSPGLLKASIENTIRTIGEKLGLLAEEYSSKTIDKE
jgi:hypothetical protein